ncbi:PREDICTED: CLK4-associating serine/arginine rich protein isoform X2 [Nanorana parkeri]|uniref:CLK4-associating serine/arginine rich protein isoform X2 n=1 Tax=Nanorana parkeri TaxID=125878 RepID=UPI0008543445|nr:PREDICTED: CLK4-associating serine/arginine rich protein isoform X2 [Nanorana parkeri]
MKTGSRMWHEARKHERKLRGMMVDYKKRAERRREYYEKIKKDPAQFLQVHGRSCKIHLDSAVALAAESPVNMMPWQGDPNNMIDRFDVRAHLDYIPEYKPPLLTTISPEQDADDRKCNYERYRGLVQNDFAGISEEQCLYQIYIDELYGGLQRPGEDEKKKLAEKKATIGYTYDDSTIAELGDSPEKLDDEDSDDDESKSDEDEVIPDIDVEVDVDEITEEQVSDLNRQATTYGMAEGDFVRMLRKDKEESEAIKHAKALEEEKAMYSVRICTNIAARRDMVHCSRLISSTSNLPISALGFSLSDLKHDYCLQTYCFFLRLGLLVSYSTKVVHMFFQGRRSRRQRREFREKRLKGRKISPPSYARRDSPTYDPYRRSQSESSSGSRTHTPSPGRAEAITFITSFGGSEDESAAGHATQTSSAATGSKRAPHTQAPGTSSSGRKEASRRRSTSSSSSSSSSRSRTSSRSRSSSKSRRDSRRRRSDSRSRSRRYSRSPVRRYSSGGGARDSRRYSRSRSPDRDRHYGGRRRSRRSRSPDRHGRGGRSSGRLHGSNQSSVSRSPSPFREKVVSGKKVSPAVVERLKRPELAVSKESGTSKAKLTPQEKLKLRMQKALNKQYKADKKAAQEKIIQQEHDRQEREDELRAMARKIRMKERERRERERDEWERHYTRSRSSSPRHSREHSSSKRRSRSKSRSPHHRH